MNYITVSLKITATPRVSLSLYTSPVLSLSLSLWKNSVHIFAP
jgi:hypothetical protein